MYTLFISDLHLNPQQPEVTQAFINFLQKTRNAEAIYILGDFVEYWIGDDDNDHKLNDAFTCLKDTANAGIPIFLMHGNRDFLISNKFSKEYNITLLDDPALINLYGESILLTHGDMLCTDDIEYQKFRKMVRDPNWQLEFLKQPLDERRNIVHNLRETSRQATEEKIEEIMDVNQKTVEQTMQAHHVQYLIHGHTHRPALHTFSMDNKRYQRWVLGDWCKQAKVLYYDENGAKFDTIMI